MRNNNVRQVSPEYQVKITRGGRRIYTQHEREQYAMKLTIIDQIVMFTLMVLVWGGVTIGVINLVMGS